MKNSISISLLALSLCSLGTGCASNDGGRGPASYSRAGRSYKEPRAMNHRDLGTDSLYQACLRERPEVSCRNRMGR